MSGIIGSKLNHRGSGPVAKLGTDGQHLLSSGAGKSANYETVASATYDDDKLQSNIALLGFKTAVNGSLAKYNLQDQIIDEFFDTSGIDSATSVNNKRSGSAPFYISGVTGLDPTGGNSTDTSITDKTIRVFTGDGDLEVSGAGTVDFLVVGGGGAGGAMYPGGGGAGGLVYKSHTVASNTYNIVVGGGGAGVTSSAGVTGGDSTVTIEGGALQFVAKGGGGGANLSGAGLAGGSSGGSGSGGSAPAAANQTSQSGDSGTYGFGYSGGTALGAPHYNTGGGGGAGAVGVNAVSASSGDGGAGKDYSAIFGTALGESGWFAGGGGGACIPDGSESPGDGGQGGGGNGSGCGGGGRASESGTDGTGGGGGGDGTIGGDGGDGIVLARYTTGSFETSGGDLTLQSTDTTAMTEPDYADMVMLMENAEGTATINTDIKGYISKDSGSTFTEGTLVDEGTWGTNKKIYAFHDLDISAQSGTSMCYKITTYNQSAGSKETTIHAVSIGWKA